VPLFLFSATFFPLTEYGAGLQAVIRLTPLYQGVVLVRGLVLGQVEWFMLVHVVYLVVVGVVGLQIASRRIVRLLRP
jgi:lipooligosaccharide transport system permease protein